MRLQSRRVKNKILPVLFVIILTLWIAHVIWGSNSLPLLLSLEARQAQQKALLFERQRENERLRNHIERLETDDVYFEQFVRGRLGLIAPGEILIEFATPTPTPVANP